MMVTQAEKDAQLARLAAVTAWVADLPVDPEPVPTGNKVVDVLFSAGERSLAFTWTPPAGITAVLVAWGDEAGFIASSGLLAPDATSWRIANLRPVPHTVDILTSSRADLVIDPTSRVTVEATPEAGPDPGDLWPSGGTWDGKRDWVLTVAGAPDDGLTVIDSQAALDAADLPGTWNPAARLWDLPGAGPLAGLDVRGEIFVRGRLPHFHAVKCQGIRFARGNQANDGLEVRFTEVGVTRHPTMAIGTGAINTWGRPNLLIARCDLSGHADGIQHAGHLLCVDTYFHDQAYSATSHNDWCQGYAGSDETFQRCYMHARPVNPHNQNGLIFTDGPSPAGADVEDSILIVEGPHRATSWIANAHMGGYRFARCLVDGRTVGKHPVTFDECEQRA